MKKLFFSTLLICSLSITSQTVKSKVLKLKYSVPEGWTATEFGGLLNWDEKGNEMCRCSGLAFSKPNKNGKFHVVVYASPVGGMDSVKREMVGNLHFVSVEKYEKATNKNFSFEKRRSNFFDTKTKTASYNVIRYIAKVEDHYYVFYVWQENMNLLNSTSEKELAEMVNAIEPL